MASRIYTQASEFTTNSLLNVPFTSRGSSALSMVARLSGTLANPPPLAPNLSTARQIYFENNNERLRRNSPIIQNSLYHSGARDLL